MNVRMCLLAILSLGDCYGYQLKNEFERRTGRTWKLNVGQVYNTLDRLERDGLVKRSPESFDGQIPYSLTSSGKLEFLAWASIGETTAALGEEQVSRIAFLTTILGSEVQTLILALRERLTSQLAELELAISELESPIRAEDLPGQFQLTSSLLRLRADRDWFELATEKLAELQARGESAQLPISSELRPRGRPHSLKRGSTRI
ncbi:MAG: PadR family transcriptional regulator [Microbacteriaceae bacterium]|nr:PadR family transcriptional regulator [Microbacteriaceae bacterium]